MVSVKMQCVTMGRYRGNWRIPVAVFSKLTRGIKVNTKFLAVSAAIVTLLAGCGGGGGGTSAPASTTGGTAGGGTSGAVSSGGTTGGTATGTTTGSIAPGSGATTGPTVPINAAITNLYATSHHYDKPNNIDPRNGDNYGVVADYTPGGDTSFEGVAAKTVTISRTVTKNGAAFSQSSQIDYFKIGPYTLGGTTYPSPNNLYVVASSQVPLPVTGTVGNSGQFYNSTTYATSAKGTPVATSTATWAITADTDTTVIFCINSVTTVTGVAGTKSASDCYRIDTLGNIPSIFFSVPN